jgi:hypothetical protein
MPRGGIGRNNESEDVDRSQSGTVQLINSYLAVPRSNIRRSYFVVRRGLRKVCTGHLVGPR